MQRLDEAMAKLEAAIDTLTDATAEAYNAHQAAQLAAQQTATNTEAAIVSASDLQALKSEIVTAIQALNRLTGTANQNALGTQDRDTNTSSDSTDSDQGGMI